MRSYREQDFDKMAERVVDRFMQGDKLADAASAEAMGGSLNPDQIARLVQAANTQAFLRLMEQQKSQGGHDMTNEFDPIDPRQIIQQLTQSVNVPHMDQPPPTASDGDAGPLPDEMSAMQSAPQGMPPGMQPGMQAPPSFGEGEAQQAMGNNTPKGLPDVDDAADNGPFPKSKKQKAKDDADKPKKKGPPKPPEKDEAKEAVFRERRLRKLADVLEDQYKQAEWAFEDAFANLQRLLSRAHGAPTMEAFEKDALALHDDEIGVAMLNMVRLDRGLPVLENDVTRSKTAALADRHVVEETDVTRTYEQIVKIATEASKLQRGAAHVRSMCS